MNAPAKLSNLDIVMAILPKLSDRQIVTVIGTLLEDGAAVDMGGALNDALAETSKQFVKDYAAILGSVEDEFGRPICPRKQDRANRESVCAENTADIAREAEVM